VTKRSIFKFKAASGNLLIHHQQANPSKGRKTKPAVYGSTSLFVTFSNEKSLTSWLKRWWNFQTQKCSKTLYL